VPWFYNSYSGKLVHEDLPSPGYLAYEAALHTATGWHELGVADSATAAQAEAWVNAHLKGGAPPDPNASPSQYASNSLGQAANKAGQAVAGTFQLTFGNDTGLLGRILKVGLGLVLIISGVVKLTGAGKATFGIAGKAAVLA
jgi:hypothetical protein